MEYILDNIGEGIIVCNKSGKILFCNKSGLKYLKFTEEELIDENIFVKVINLKTELEVAKLKEYEVKNRLDEKQMVEGKFIFDKWEEKDSVFFIFKIREINMKKLSEKLYYELKKRKEAEVELEGFLLTATDCMSIVDENGKFEKISSGWKFDKQWNMKNFDHIRWCDLVHYEDIAEMRRKLNSSKETGEIVEFEGRFINRRGEWLWLSTRSIYDKERKVFINTSKDITEEKKLEEERLKYERLKELENIKNDFFANISHEFKTPLNIILSLIQLMDSYIINKNITIEPLDNFEKYIQGIRQNSYRLLRLSNNIIDMTRIDSGFYNLNKKNCNIVYIMDNIVESIAEYVKSKGIDIIFDPAVEEVITACDEEKFERIILNLISNAIKYIQKDGLILINLNVENNCVVISIEDNGIGISKENLESIFERFKQVDSTFTRKVEGSGIGLSLVKSIVELHNGDIYIESEEGKGTKVTFYLPIIKVEEKEQKNDFKTLNKNEVWKIEFSDIYD